ncbi:acyl-CoA dehydrogenase [Cryobacterium sp. Hh7]|uniref:acyl-CoA dehydrogenase family protein n=1 Tax=Cryobacterium sp. Hh7 TaxID=1259159 RepID=UPI00106A6AAD|nr:acyl-CoA dehydrogenase [Cryobacterium sp. Hh7]TFD50725.1 acyl-CoA dehydrogenase [Cryobacterium sp. Hh7]
MAKFDDDPTLHALRTYCDDSLSAAAMEIDRSGEFLRDVLLDFAEMGIQRLHLDDNQVSADSRSWMRIHESSKLIAKSSTAAAVAVSVARLHTYLLVKYTAAELRDKWLEPTLSATAFGSFAITEPDAGTDVRAMSTIAKRVEGGYQLSGHKCWIGLAPIADYSFVLAKLDSDDRGAQTVALFVDLSSGGVSRPAQEPLSGLRGMPNGQLAFDDVFVPELNRLDCDGFMGMMDGLNLARIEAASYSCGLILRSIELSVERAANREIFGEPLLKKQITQQRIGQMYADYLAADMLTERAVESYAKGDGGDPTLISTAKLFATEKARHHSDTAMQFWGAAGLVMHSDVERIHRDAKVMQIFDGTSEIHQLMLGKQAVRAVAGGAE